MSRPAFQFYPADWRKNANLRRCSEAARGAWIELLCLFHDSDEYGVLRWPLAEIVRAAGVTRRSVYELIDKGVLKGADRCAPDFIWAPTHAGRKGDDVVLVAAGEGPCWYSSRFVVDEHKRLRRGEGTRFGDESGPDPRAARSTSTRQPKASPTRRIGDGEGDGPSSASSSSSASPLTDTPSHPTHAASDEGAPARRSPAAEVAIALRHAGFLRANPQDPRLLDALIEGVPPDAIVSAARVALTRSDVSEPFAWSIQTALHRHRNGQPPLTPENAHAAHQRGSAIEQVEAHVRRAHADDHVIEGTAVAIGHGR